MWVYGSGFPKSLNVSKSIEGLLTTGSANKTAFKNLAGEQVERGDWGIAKQQFTHGQRDTNYDETASATRLGKLKPTTAEAKEWDGWGTALKPAHEPIVLARKPLDGTVANNVLKHGVGGLNIDGCRVGDEVLGGGTMPNLRDVGAMSKEATGIDKLSFGQNPRPATRLEHESHVGRFPANFIHDGSDEVLQLFPDTKSGKLSDGHKQGSGMFGLIGGQTIVGNYGGDSGSAARFFYCAKASKKDRNEGLEEFEAKRDADRIKDDGAGGENPRNRSNTAKLNHHPTVKPTDLMRYLCRLVTPPNGTVLDPFTGSGSTGKAAVLEGFSFIGVEQSEEYIAIAEARIQSAKEDK
jgi:site-specific DNA-methyltransferase (adenine-specific)